MRIQDQLVLGLVLGIAIGILGSLLGAPTWASVFFALTIYTMLTLFTLRDQR